MKKERASESQDHVLGKLPLIYLNTVGFPIHGISLCAFSLKKEFLEGNSIINLIFLKLNWGSYQKKNYQLHITTNSWTDREKENDSGDVFAAVV